MLSKLMLRPDAHNQLGNKRLTKKRGTKKKMAERAEGGGSRNARRRRQHAAQMHTQNLRRARESQSRRISLPSAPAYAQPPKKKKRHLRRAREA